MMLLWAWPVPVDVAGEAKNLLTGSGGSRNTFCAIRLDSEEIYRTAVVEKSQEWVDLIFVAVVMCQNGKLTRHVSELELDWFPIELVRLGVCRNVTAGCLVTERKQQEVCF